MHDSANTQRCSIDRSVQWEFWAVVSQTGLLRKLYPTTQANSGPQFPDGASWGNCIPLRNAKMGWAFRLRPLAETASRKRHSDWDAFSRSNPSGKLRSGICPPQNGTRFPQGPNQPPAPRQNDPFPSAPQQIKTKLRWNSSCLGFYPAKTGTISPQLQKPVQATVVTCAGLVGAHKGTLQGPTSVMDYRTAPARDASVGVPSDEACRSPRQSAQCRQSADTAK